MKPITTIFLSSVILAGICSCTANRTITTTQSATRHGDTTITITTRTVEEYRGKINYQP